MVSYGCTLTPKAEERKRELIEKAEDFINRGMSNAYEMERLINSILVKDLTHPRTRGLFVEDKE